MKETLPHINKWLRPFSWVYGLVVYLRNKFFAWGILKQRSFDIPIICVGNISAGGTGKTPHIEYLIRLLHRKYKVAVLSRGYKRKTNGYILADDKSTSSDIGDESYQIKRKFPNVLVAVDAKRVRAIEHLLALDEDKRPDIILLDDAFQHRYVKPSWTILLSDHSRPYYKDKLLPMGHLRESISHLESVNTFVVSKCPIDIKPIDQRIITHEINPYPYQNLLFTSLKYGNLTPIFHGVGPNLPLESLKDKNVMLIVGIANPSSLIEKIEAFTSQIQILNFPDHHNFAKKDIKQIETLYTNFTGNRIIITTEKDAVRLMFKNLSEDLKKSLYYLPIEVSFLDKEDQKIFNEKIINHVETNRRNS